MQHARTLAGLKSWEQRDKLADRFQRLRLPACEQGEQQQYKVPRGANSLSGAQNMAKPEPQPPPGAHHVAEKSSPLSLITWPRIAACWRYDMAQIRCLLALSHGPELQPAGAITWPRVAACWRYHMARNCCRLALSHGPELRPAGAITWPRIAACWRYHMAQIC